MVIYVLFDGWPPRGHGWDMPTRQEQRRFGQALVEEAQLAAIPTTDEI